ncbi:hypothetical protein [Desulfitobacterium sp. AusDCA]
MDEQGEQAILVDIRERLVRVETSQSIMIVQKMFTWLEEQLNRLKEPS